MLRAAGLQNKPEFKIKLILCYGNWTQLLWEKNPYY